MADMVERDRADSTRSVAPAVAAPDAILLDNSGMTLEQSLEALLEIVKNKTGKSF